ncbi:MAG: type II toxin-antitoxin system prevent-host-death family antitoxin [Patescibacteria group bacterium]
MDNLIALKDLRIKLTDYTKRAERGESFLVIRKSKPVFKIVPIEEKGWETIVDFTQIDPKGILISKVLKTLKEMS